MPFALLPALQWLANGFWSFASSTLGQIIISFTVAWLWSGYRTNAHWEAVIAAEKAAAQAAYQKEVIRQQQASSQILADANARAEKEAAIAADLQRQIDEFNAQEPKNDQSPQPQSQGSKGVCSIDGDFAGVVRRLDATARKGKVAKRPH